MTRNIMLKSVLMLTALYKSTAYWNVRYELLHYDGSIPLHHLIHCGQKFLGPIHTGVRINRYSLQSNALDHSWSQNSTYDETTYVYMKKMFFQDLYDPPKHLYRTDSGDKSIYFSYIPGVPTVNTRLTLTVQPVDPWNRFVVVFRDMTTGNTQFKMKIWKDQSKIFFTNAIGAMELDTEIAAIFPMSSNTTLTLTFTIKDTFTQVDVNDRPYYDYTHYQDPTYNSISIWFSSLPDELYLHDDDNSIPLHQKINFGQQYLDAKYVGLRINTQTLEAQGIWLDWLKSATLANKYMYMIKSFAQDVYDPPKYMHYTAPGNSSSYYTQIPGILDVGARIVIVIQFFEPWFRTNFNLHTSQGTTALRMKLMNRDNETIFRSRSINGSTIYEETNSNFPFMANYITTIEFIVKETFIQVDVDGQPYHSYQHLDDPTTINALRITMTTWNSDHISHSISHSILYNVTMYFPSTF